MSRILEAIAAARASGWEPSLILVVRRKRREPITPEEARRRHLARGAKRLRRRRASRRYSRHAAQELPARCQWEGCHNLLRFRGMGPPPRYCSKTFHPGYWRKVQPTPRKCAAPGCEVVLQALGKKRACSNACRQRAWYHRRGCRPLTRRGAHEHE